MTEPTTVPAAAEPAPREHPESGGMPDARGQSAEHGAMDHGAMVESELTPPAVLRSELPLPVGLSDFVMHAREQVQSIVSGSDSRLLVVVGPCSVHDTDSALAYARWLKPLQERVADALLLVMRVYVEKPRTRYGWKGLVNDPRLDGSCRIDEGLRVARRLLIQVNETGVPAATEFVDVATPAWLGDLVSWSALGARSIESQPHRQMTSGLACPVGFKNGTGGNVEVAVNAMLAASAPQHYVGISNSGHAVAVESSGNRHIHLVLRGGGGASNHQQPSVEAAARRLAEQGLNRRVMVDCGHGNSTAGERGQLTVAGDIVEQVARGSETLLGIMLESNLIAGRQAFTVGLTPRAGLSITDSCLGLDDTERVIEDLAAARRKAVLLNSAAGRPA